MKIKKYYLIFAFVTVTIIALLYGISPDWFTKNFLGIEELQLDLAHIFRAVMCLYLALGLFWLYGAFNKNYANFAILTTIIFASGLVVGRIISYVIDGQPSAILMLYLFMELALIPLAYWVLKLPD